MADCFSLPSIESLVSVLRLDAKMNEDVTAELGVQHIENVAADTIEAMAKEIEYLREQAQRGSDYWILKGERDKLHSENAKLKAERDAIRDALVAGGTYCGMCKKYISCPSSEDCKGEKFEWRGVQKEEEDATD